MAADEPVLPSARTAAVVAVGDEILAGDVLDGNSLEVAARLRDEGFWVRSVQCVGDDVLDVVRAVRAAAAHAAVVVVTGGLGPTRDDRTRDALARVAGVPLIEDPESLRAIEERFVRFGRTMPASNRVQALLPAGARALENPLGTAPGIGLQVGEARVFALPGVPMEMRRMLEDVVLPGVRARHGRGVPRARVRIHAHGLPESEAGDRLADLMAAENDPVVGITVAGGILTVSITARSTDEAAGEMVRSVAAECERRLGDAVFGRDGATLEQEVVRLLGAGRLTLATAESCTGGLVARLITRVPGASAVFLEGVVAYSNQAKATRLGVDPGLIERHGAVSSEVAATMAQGIAASTGADLGVAVTGVAGPGGGTPDKPVGLIHFGLCREGRVTTRRVLLPGDRDAIQVRAAHVALDLVRRAAHAGRFASEDAV